MYIFEWPLKTVFTVIPTLRTLFASKDSLSRKLLPSLRRSVVPVGSFLKIVFITVACNFTWSYSFCIKPLAMYLSTSLSLKHCSLKKNYHSYHSCIEIVTQSCLKPLSNEWKSMLTSWDSHTVWTWNLIWQYLKWALTCLSQAALGININLRTQQTINTYNMWLNLTLYNYCTLILSTSLFTSAGSSFIYSYPP